MTEKLYYRDAYIKEFHAKVLSVEPERGGYRVELDKTAFFPEEGGQSCDTGTLGEASISHVYEKEGIIYHISDKPLTVGASVSGEIDAPERFRKMQNHTAEHIVSGLIHKNFGLRNVGFHLSRDEMTADFDGELKEDEMLPSIRGLAKDLRISFITTKRAYEELEKEGFIYTLPAKGCYVAPKNVELLREENLKKIEEHIEQIAKLAASCNLSRDDIMEMITFGMEEQE